VVEDQQLPAALDHPDCPFDPVDAAFRLRDVPNWLTYFFVRTCDIGSIALRSSA
jgi:hypothetical protein